MQAFPVRTFQSSRTLPAADRSTPRNRRHVFICKLQAGLPSPRPWTRDARTAGGVGEHEAFFYEAPRAPDWNRSSIAEVFPEADIVEVFYQMREALKYARRYVARLI